MRLINGCGVPVHSRVTSSVRLLASDQTLKNGLFTTSGTAGGRKAARSVRFSSTSTKHRFTNFRLIAFHPLISSHLQIELDLRVRGETLFVDAQAEAAGRRERRVAVFGAVAV